MVLREIKLPWEEKEGSHTAGWNPVTIRNIHWLDSVQPLGFFNSSYLRPPSPHHLHMLIHQSNLWTWGEQPDHHTHWPSDFELTIMLTYAAFSIHHKRPALWTYFVFRVKIVFPFQEICCLCQILQLALKVFMVSYCCMRNCKQILKAQRA